MEAVTYGPECGHIGDELTSSISTSKIPDKNFVSRVNGFD